MKFIHGDSTEALRSIPTASVDMVLCDPPYMINTKSDGSGKLNPWTDYMNAAYWYKEWFSQVRRILKPTGCFWTFLNWRSFATFQKAACDLRWPIESCLIWDKLRIGPSGPKGLRSSYEMVLLFTMPEFRFEDRSVADVQAFKWSAVKPHGHPAEKPVDLCEFLIRHCTKPGDVVLDCFMGSGTTGEAAVGIGRDFIGIELDDHWFEEAKRRVEQAYYAQQDSLF